MLIYCIVTWLIAIGTLIEINTINNRLHMVIGIILAPISVPICIGMAIQRIYQKL